MWRAFDYKRTMSRLEDDKRGIENKSSLWDDVYEWEDYACGKMGMSEEDINASEVYSCGCEKCLSENVGDRFKQSSSVGHVPKVRKDLE